MTTFKMPEPVTRIFFDELCGVEGFYKVSQVQPCLVDFPVYTAQDMRDVLEQAAQKCEHMFSDGALNIAEAIRAMKEQIK